MSKTAILLIGFGGPERRADFEPFLRSVAQGTNIPDRRIREVLRHYELVGPSPYNAQVFRIKEALEKRAGAPVFAGFRHSAPSIEEACERLKKERIEKTVCFVLAPFRCYASFEKYKAKVDPSLNIVFTPPFHNHPLFIEAQAEQIGPGPVDDATFFIFSAHSIPQKMDDESAYSLQFRETASLAAKKAGLKHWEIAYQSRSARPRLPDGGQGNPAEPWLEPSLEKALERVDGKKFKTVCVIPAGFLVENMEILYDLDIEFRKNAEGKGFSYFRARTVADHPRFIEMMGQMPCQT
ncbi:MAG: ferrochelatase [Candidatus Omnitrophica bacterium]|nr:ferrochelatase [Candidatus Omnitrophota bacterium]